MVAKRGQKQQTDISQTIQNTGRNKIKYQKNRRTGTKDKQRFMRYDWKQRVFKGKTGKREGEMRRKELIMRGA